MLDFLKKVFGMGVAPVTAAVQTTDGPRRPAQRKPSRPSAHSARRGQSDKPRPPTAPKSVAPRTPPSESASAQDDEVIDSLARLPAYLRVLSGDGGLFAINASQRSDYAVLETESIGDERHALLLVTRHLRKEPFTLGLARMLDSDGANGRYRVRIALATESVIQSIYESNSNDDDAKLKYQRSFEDLVAQALKMSASDIHIEVRKSSARLRFRINGELRDMDDLAARYAWSTKTAKEMATVVYTVIADPDSKDVTFNPSKPQDAKINFDTLKAQARLATMPAYPEGFDMVLRLLRLAQDERPVPLQDLGYAAAQIGMISLGMSKPTGAVIFAGTTGSGKSTSMKVLLTEKIRKAKDTIKVITVEDPPEYFIPGATQSPVVRSKKSDDEKNPFAASIRAAMRSDPDIIMVGEVRDDVSAKLLRDAVQSGHQVFTTVHAESAMQIVSRLNGMGLERDVLGDTGFLSAMIWQSLLPVLCPDCSVPLSEKLARGELHDKQDTALLRRLSVVCDVSSDDIRFRGCGCSRCAGSGIKGRTVAAEVIVPDHVIQRHIREGNNSEAWMHWRKKGGMTALEHGISKMRKGLVDPYELEEYLGFMTIDKIMEDGEIDISKEIAMATGYDDCRPQEVTGNADDTGFADLSEELSLSCNEAV